jgi:Flp pilus assembly pilin Flp
MAHEKNYHSTQLPAVIKAPHPHFELKKRSLRFLAVFFAEEAAQDDAEYALIALLLALFALASIKGLSGKISNAYSALGTGLTTNITHPASAAVASVTSTK